MVRKGFTRFWLTIGFAVLLVVIFLVAWALSLSLTEQDVLETYNQQQRTLVAGAAGGIEGVLEDLASSIASLAELPEVQSFEETGTRRELNRKLQELAPQGLVELGVLDANGLAAYFAVDTTLEGVDYSWRDYFRAARSRAQGEVGQPLILALQPVRPGEPGFAIAIPFWKTPSDEADAATPDDLAGVLQGTLSFDVLTERYLIPFKPPADGHIFLVDDELQVLWASDEALTGANLLSGSQAALHDMAGQMQDRTQLRPRGYAYIYEDPRERRTLLVAFAPMEVGGAFLALGAQTPAEVARQVSYANMQSQQLVFTASLVTILAGVLVGGILLNLEVRRRFAAETALQQSQREQAVLEERNRLAGDLHDSVTQGLYSMVLHAGAAAAQLDHGRPDKSSAYLEEIVAAGQESLAEMRLLIFELRPPILEKEGLAAALEMRLFAVERRAGLKTAFESDFSGRLPVDIEDGLYRIAQEALNNTLKHAAAQNVSLDLSRHDSRILLQVRDDGCGFDPDAAQGTGGMGLAGMRERAQKIGAELHIVTSPAQGTTITVELNL